MARTKHRHKVALKMPKTGFIYLYALCIWKAKKLVQNLKT